ncbi:MAG TPA: hypothetical protein DCR07_01680, partial [Lactococcus sp.]|nr:hypothetical protein [Lactococcus sp.]
MTEAKTMKDWALFYHDKGLNVIPISTSKNKTPLVKFKDKYFSREEVIQMWTKYPTANIAITTDKLFVIDIDVGHSEGVNGYDSIEKYPNKHLLPPTLEAKTASGGKHLIYLKREDMKIQQIIGWLPGVDVKASKNNYFLVAPSKTDKGAYEWLNQTPIATAPMQLVSDIMEGKGYDKSNWRAKNDFSKTYASQMWELFIKGAPEGARNH